MPTISIPISLFIIAGAMIGCTDKSLQPAEESPISNSFISDQKGSFSIAIRIPKVAISHVARVEYIVTATDIDTISLDFHGSEMR